MLRGFFGDVHGQDRKPLAALPAVPASLSRSVDALVKKLGNTHKDNEEDSDILQAGVIHVRAFC